MFQQINSELLFPQLSEIIFCDSDTVWLRDPYDLWQEFNKMTPENLWALAQEYAITYRTETWAPSWGKIFNQSRESWGLNSGIILFNLTRMRNFSWSTVSTEIVKEAKISMGLPDQNYFNLMTARNRNLLYVRTWLEFTNNWKCQMEI